jgi:hypothetical protein
MSAPNFAWYLVGLPAQGRRRAELVIQLLEHMSKVDVGACDDLLADPEATEALFAMATKPIYIDRALSINLGSVAGRSQEEYR